ncbi:tripartite tricarboxylate transporter substrate binding protein [Xylophilus sp. GOD-11R]|uniref:Bug family tripartite tricarboxylate transporter substrate binding protein n=1 Tax=Xylophilus sp. GOD-11R TaxID=3089814 RepID=UPI00298D4002|nr:tripartite tricarboxylate transporter substrate binding protein [Xylophilus sp. GOD-11R]WPB58390.1 tripartite tricarboxylate transporter substrate binding protein [Xylophilus sp. GOD-11R]
MFSPIPLGRRAVLAGGLAALAAPAFAQAWPNKPIRLVIPFAPGGVTDMVGRVLAQGLAAELGQPVVAENRAGASGLPGAEFVAKSAPDGYTLMIGNISTLAVNAAAFARLPYDPQASFAFISMAARQPLIVAVNPQVEARTLAELVKLAKARPDSLNFGSAGASLQLATEAFNQAAGLRMTHVPYKGSGPAMTDLVAGNIQVLFDAFSSLQPFVQSDRVRALAITSSQRSPLAPELPTLVELGYPEVDVTSWQALVAPAGTPPTVVARLNEALRKVIDAPATRAQFARQGVEAQASSPEQLRDFAATELQRWRQVAKRANLKPE